MARKPIVIKPRDKEEIEDRGLAILLSKVDRSKKADTDRMLRKLGAAE